MKTVSDLMRQIKSAEGMTRLGQLYGTREGVVARQLERYMLLLKRHEELYGVAEAPLLLSAPGRVELCGNHTDHNNGRVLAAAVNLDTVAALSRRDDPCVTMHSEGFGTIRLSLDSLSPVPAERGTPAAIIRGVAARLTALGLKVGGFDATVMSDVLTGSGLSSSAAFEVLVCAAFERLFQGETLDATLRAQTAQYAENEYFGKPCGLMDQLSCATGGVIAVDFRHGAKVEPMQLDLTRLGYSLIVVNTGGSHDDMTREYAAIREEMQAVARCFGEATLRPTGPEQLFPEMARVRREAGDRAALRAVHYYAENERVERLTDAVKAGDMRTICTLLNESGRSSWMYLQNVYASPDAQPLGIALAMAESMLAGRGAWRVHGGGFAGTTLNLVPLALEESFARAMNGVFGDHACRTLTVRAQGVTAVF